MIKVAEWSTLIGPDSLEILCSHWSRSVEILSSHWSRFSLVEPYYAGAKVYAITTHLKASRIPPTRGTWCLSVCCYGFHAQKGSIIGDLMPLRHSERQDMSWKGAFYLS